MSASQVPCSPLDWEQEFLFLLKELSVIIHRAPESKKKLFARYQTAIALGGYLGPRAKELLHIKWVDIIGKKEKDIYEFKTEKKRKVYFNEKLLQIAVANFKIVNPINLHDFILESPKDPGRPITTRAFNQMLQRLFNKINITTDNPSSHTLRKTFAFRVFQKKGGDDLALIFLSEMLNHGSTSDTRRYLGLQSKQIKDIYLNLD